MPVVVSGILGAIAYWFHRKRKRARSNTEPVQTPASWRKVLLEKVNFYQNLSEDEQLQFETDVQRFLREVTVTGVKVDVSLEDRLLVASSAVITLFGFPDWTYQGLTEVLLYAGPFDRDFNVGGEDARITGMVGSGTLQGKVLLSRPALHHGFDNASDKKNVGIHEFAHYFDAGDGAVDGVPPGLTALDSALWLELVHTQMGLISAGRSDIDAYGGYSREEFFAVTSEYFFERPDLLSQKHPQLYEILSKVFKQDRAMVIDPATFRRAVLPSRNAICPCGSGKKYKKCCIS